MAKDRAHRAKRDHRHHHQRARPAGKDPRQHDVDPDQAHHQPDQRIRHEVALLLCLPRQHPGDTALFGDAGQDHLLDLAGDLIGARRVVLGNIAGHRDLSHPVLAPDGGKPGLAAHRDDIGQRHPMPGGRAQLHPVDEIGGQLLGGQFDPDRGRAHPIGETRRLGAVETGPQLAAQRGDVKAQSLALRGQIQRQLLLVIGKVVLDRRHFGELRQRGLEIFGGILEITRLRPRELHRDPVIRPARTEAAETDLFDQRQARRFLLQALHELGAGIGAVIGVDHLDRDRAEQIGILGIGRGQRAPRSATDLPQRIQHRVDAIVVLELLGNALHRVLHRAHHRLGIGARGPLDHRESAVHRALLGRVEKAPLHLAADHEGHLPCQQRNRCRDHRIAQHHHRAGKGFHHAKPEPIQPGVHLARGPVIPFVIGTMGQGMAHVIGQDQEAFDQRGQQHRDHRIGNIDNHIAHAPANHRQPGKSDHRGQRRGKDRRSHAPRAAFGGHHRVFAQMARTEIGMFAHHDRIIHHDPQRQDQREDRDHVQRHARKIHHRQGRSHRGRNPHSDPERCTRIEEQEQQSQYQPQAKNAVASSRDRDVA